MPIQPFTVNRAWFKNPVADESHIIRQKSGWLARAYFPIEANAQEYLVKPGLILAESTVSGMVGYYVPYSATVAYGGGSDTAVAVLHQLVDLSLGDEGAAPVVHGKLVEAHCYVLGSDYGSIPAGVKTSLKLIEWV